MVHTPKQEGPVMALSIQAVDTPVDGIITAEDSAKYEEVVKHLTTPGVIWDKKNEETGEVEVKGALDNPTRELILSADTKGDAEQYQGYARAWGKRQDPQIDIRKSQSKGGDPRVIRSTVKTVDPTKPQPGRKPNATTTPDSTQPPATPAPAPQTAPSQPEADGKTTAGKK